LTANPAGKSTMRRTPSDDARRGDIVAAASREEGRMADEPGKRNLGRGLSALLGGAPPEGREDDSRSPRSVPIEALHPGRFQPRKQFPEEALEALAQSIRENGILQPLVVRRHPEKAGAWEIVAGERRWRAAQRVRLHEVPVVVRELADRAALEIALVENVQRQDLGALEEAEGYRRLIDEFGHSQEALARQIGKSRSHVANTLRLLKLPPAVRQMLEAGTISAGHARALLGAVNAEALARRAVAEDLSVRAVEQLVAGAGSPRGARSGGAGGGPARRVDADTAALERTLAERLGLKVVIEHGAGGGTLSVHYTTLEQLDDVVARLSRAGT
jgi:ParB family chromosome partitioning protein